MCKRLIGPGHHQTHAAVAGAQRAARHRGIQHQQAALGQAAGQGLRFFRRQRGAQHHQLAGLHGGCGALRAKQHLGRLRGVHHAHNQRLGLLHGLRSARRRLRPQAGQGAHSGGVHIMHMKRPAQRQQTRGHARAHIAHPHNSHGKFLSGGHQVCTSRLDLAMDIKIPNANPNVTMAVPP